MGRLFLIVSLLIGTSAAIQVHAQNGFVDSLQRIADRHTGDSIEVNALDHLVTEFLRTDLQRARDRAWALKTLSSKIQNETGMLGAYVGLMNIHMGAGRTDSAEYYVKALDRLSKENSNNKKIALAHAHTAGLFYRNTGRYKEALPYLLEALRLIGPDGDKTRRAGQLLNIANNYYAMSDFENASKSYIQSLALFEEVGNKRGQSFCLQGFGNTYKELGRYDLSEKYFLRSEKLKEELGDKRGLISTWMSIGGLYQDMGQYERSLSYATKGLAAAQEMKTPDQEMKFFYNIGSVLKSMKRFEDSRKNYSASLKIAQTSGDTAFITRIKTDLIMLDTDNRKLKNDEHALIEHVQIAMENGDRELTAEGRHKLAEWYSLNGRHAEAYEQLKIAHDLADSIRGADIQVQIKRMEEEYLGEKKDREITLLKKDQELHEVELSRRNTMVTAVLIALFSVVVISLVLVNRYRVVNNAKRSLEIERVRNNIARDLHDEMGSALSSINILSKVAMVEGETATRQYLQNIGDQSEKMMESMGDMVWSINPRNDNLEKVIARMREFATEILDAKNIDYVFSENLPPDVVIDTDKRKNLFMIFKEAVNNAAKYSNATKMEMSLVVENDNLVLTVKDDGKGFDENVAKAGNGLRNMRERAGESGGTLAIKSAPGMGTEVQLRMRIA